ncbi:16511_t:CDS:2, partial [Racocetra persica]
DFSIIAKLTMNDFTEFSECLSPHKEHSIIDKPPCQRQGCPNRCSGRKDIYCTACVQNPYVTVNQTPPPPVTVNQTPPLPSVTVNQTPPPPGTVNQTPPPLSVTVNQTPPPPVTVNQTLSPPSVTVNQTPTNPSVTANQTPANPSVTVNQTPANPPVTVNKTASPPMTINKTSSSPLVVVNQTPSPPPESVNQTVLPPPSKPTSDPVIYKTEKKLLEQTDPEYLDVLNSFRVGLPGNIILGIFKLNFPINLVIAHEQYKKNNQTMANIRGFHGTKSVCGPKRFISNPKAAFCKSGCGACGIAQNGNKIKFSGDGLLWFANNSSVSLYYCNNGGTRYNVASEKTMFVVDIITSQPGPVYTLNAEAAVIPKYLIIFQ